jgi:hypothetical protein
MDLVKILIKDTSLLISMSVFIKLVVVSNLLLARSHRITWTLKRHAANIEEVYVLELFLYHESQHINN